jgi:hypothetical protein
LAAAGPISSYSAVGPNANSWAFDWPEDFHVRRKIMRGGSVRRRVEHGVGDPFFLYPGLRTRVPGGSPHGLRELRGEAGLVGGLGDLAVEAGVHAVKSARCSEALRE